MANTVIERVIDDWLTNTTERAFQAPFCQMLVARGETVIHSSRHCAMELGKDVISIAENGCIHAYQLKTAHSGRLGLSAWRDGIQQQVFDLVVSAVAHPSIKACEKHHRSFFVINGELDEEVSADIVRMNQQWANQGMPHCVIETIVRGQLYEMATSLDSAFWPTELASTNTLLEMYLDSGVGQLPKHKMASLLEDTARFSRPDSEKTSKQQARRLMASLGVLTAIATAKFSMSGNKLGEIEAWVMCLASVLGVAQRHNLPEKLWRPAVSLIELFTRKLIEELVEEVRMNPSLIVGHPVSDRAVRRVRIAHLIALFSVLWIWRRQDRVEEDDLDIFIRDFCISNFKPIDLWGEGAVVQAVVICWGLRSMAPHIDVDKIIVECIESVTKINGKGGDGTFHSPYYTYEDIAVRAFKSDEVTCPESFRHRSHTAESLLALLVRSNCKQATRLLWPGLSHLMFANFQPEKQWHTFRWRNPHNGKLVMQAQAERQSWAELRKKYLSRDSGSIPRVIRKAPILATLFLTCYPHRICPHWVCWLDEAMH